MAFCIAGPARGCDFLTDPKDHARWPPKIAVLLKGSDTGIVQPKQI
jgi:hypothetical protein